MGATSVARSGQGIKVDGVVTTIAGRPHRPSREGSILYHRCPATVKASYCRREAPIRCQAPRYFFGCATGSN